MNCHVADAVPPWKLEAVPAFTRTSKQKRTVEPPAAVSAPVAVGGAVPVDSEAV